MRALGIHPVNLLSASGTASLREQDELIARVKRGDPSALGDVYDLHHQAVRSFARRLVGSTEEAEDLVHEAFLTLPGALAGFEGRSSLRTFLISIASNHARHFVRAAARRRAAIDRYAWETPEDAANPERQASDRELADALTRGLDELPIEQRVAFVLCDVEGRSSAEAGEIVQAPEATVRTRLFHARRKLRDSLAKGGYR